MEAVMWVLAVIGSLIVGRMVGYVLVMLTGDHPWQAERGRRGLHRRHAYGVAQHQRTGKYDPLVVARLERECFGRVLSEDAAEAERKRLGWADRAILHAGESDYQQVHEDRRAAKQRVHARLSENQKEWDRLLRDIEGRDQ